MAKSQNQKLKLLYLMDYLQKNSDERHPVTVAQMIAYLGEQGIPAERKSLYGDLEALRRFGLDVIQVKAEHTGYYIGERSFELPELKLLVDSVQSSRFLTLRKTVSLIKKLEGLTSKYCSEALRRQVYIRDRVKTMNESIYYLVDDIQSAILQKRKISFQYFDYSVSKERVFRHGGKRYLVTPVGLTGDHENYYMVCMDAESGAVKNFRVDKMANICITEERADGNDLPDMDVYTARQFSMFTGEERDVVLEFRNDLVGAVIDRFGKDVILVPEGSEHFSVVVRVAVSPQFFGWLCGFGAEARLVGPEDVVGEMREHVRAVADCYPENK